MQDSIPARIGILPISGQAAKPSAGSMFSPSLLLSLPSFLYPVFAGDSAREPQLWLSGGGALRVLLGKANEGVWKGDWDVYCTTAGFKRIREMTGLEFVEETHREQHLYRRLKNEDRELHVFTADAIPLPSSWWKNWDLSICKVAISMAGVLIDPQAFSDLLSRQFRTYHWWIDKPENPSRLTKYEQRGFRLAADSPRPEGYQTRA